ncbi:MAG: hypothetical protein KGZ75_15310 [Syntrophomonadaceae bacterium]|nr:hypothetical protein [Syntrophomonadaceae bacterium]
MPAVTVGEPKKAKEHYSLLDVEGVKIYLPPSLQQTDQKPRIGLQKFLFFHQLEIFGYSCQ